MSGVRKSTLFKFVLNPFRSGLLGFLLFIVVLIITKFLGKLMGTVPKVTIDAEDFLLSSIGFAMFFLIKFLENFGVTKPQLVCIFFRSVCLFKFFCFKAIFECSLYEYCYQREYLIIGLVFDLRATSKNLLFVNADEIPVPSNAAGMFLEQGTAGQPSKIFTFFFTKFFIALLFPASFYFSNSSGLNRHAIHLQPPYAQRSPKKCFEIIPCF